jgi:hypothetical protein
MEKDLLKHEIRRMLQFHKSVLLWLVKTCFCVLRYGLWLLPWILLALFVWKPVLTGWRAFTQKTSGPAQITQAPFSAPARSIPGSGRSSGWETIPGKVDSGMRTVERISRRIRKK